MKKIAAILSVIFVSLLLMGCNNDPNQLNIRYSGSTKEKYYIVSGYKKGGKITNTNVIIPDTIKGEKHKTVIGKSAFENAQNLVSVTLANDTIMIGKNAFKDSSLSEIVILEDSYLREIHSYAFANSKIKKIFIPTSVEFIGENVFDDLIGLDIYTSHSVEDMSIFHNIKNPNATIHYSYRYFDYEQLK